MGRIDKYGLGMQSGVVDVTDGIWTGLRVRDDDTAYLRRRTSVLQSQIVSA
jgi:hypothetical protein